MPRKQKKYHYIYKTTNLVNKKYYVGMHSTDNLDDGYIGSGKRLWYSIKKYGKKNFKCEILEILPNRKKLKEREKEIINENFLQDDLCMNIQLGGGGGISSVEHEQKLREGASDWAKAQWKNPEYREKITEMLRENMRKNHVNGKIRYDTTKGKKISTEHKRKIGESNKIKQSGSSNSQFGTCWITNGFENKKIKKNDLSLYPEWKQGRILK